MKAPALFVFAAALGVAVPAAAQAPAAQASKTATAIPDQKIDIISSVTATDTATIKGQKIP